MKKPNQILAVLLWIGLSFSLAWSEDQSILQKAKAQADPAQAIELYWQYFHGVGRDSLDPTAADDFADLLAEHHRSRDLVLFGDQLCDRGPLLASPLNTIAYELAQKDTALDKALSFSRSAVEVTRAAIDSPAPPDRSAKAWKERNRARLGYYLDTQGFVLLKKKDGKQALEALQEAHSVLSDEPDSDMFLHLAQAHWLMNNAVETLNWALKARYYAVDRQNSDIKQLIHDAYVKANGSAQGLDESVNDSMEGMRLDEYEKMVSEKLNLSAPNFALKTLDGSILSLEEYRGHVVLVDFWATWCGPCKRELPLLQAAYTGWKDKGVAFLAISTDKDTAEVAPFIAEKKYTFPVLFNRGTSKDYEISGIPTLFVIDQNGRIQYKHVGYRPDVVDIINLQIAELGKKQ